MKAHIVAVCTVAALTAGCASLPGFDQSPAVDRVARLKPEAASPWTYDFGDLEFRQILVAADLRALDVKSALARAQAADAAIVSARAEGWPTLNASAGAAREIPGRRSSPRETATRANLDLGLSSNWTLDLTGRIAAALRAARADRDGARFDVEIARATLGAELARAYLSIRAADERLARLARREEAENAALQLAQLRLDVGLTPATEVLSRRQTLAAIAQDRAAIRATRQQSLHRLAVLSGKSPNAVAVAAGDLSRLSALDIAMVFDTERVTGRLDVSAAAARLAAADARRLEAARAALPRLTLAVSAGASGDAWNKLVERRNAVVTPTLRLEGAIFDGGANRARLRQADAAAAEAEIRYLQTRLRAEEALANIVDQRASIDARRAPAQTALDAAREQFRLSRLRLEAGRESRLEALDAERALIDAEERDAELRRENLAVSIEYGAAVLGAGGGN